MTILGWIVVGVLAALLFNVTTGSHGLLQDAIVGIVGAVVGGWLFVVATGGSVIHITPADLVAAAVASLLFVAMAHRLTLDRTAI